jgi:hypothetical protein
MPTHIIQILTRYNSTYHAKCGSGKNAYTATCTASALFAAQALLKKWYGGKGIDTLVDTKKHDGEWRIWEADVSAQSKVLSKSDNTEVEIIADDDLGKRHEQALQAAGKTISDEQIGDAIQSVDKAAHDYLTQCLIAGAILCAAKAATPHGKWKTRIEKIAARCNFGAVGWRQAYTYMKLWKALIDDLDAGRIMTSRNNSLDIDAEQLLAIPESGKLGTRVKSAIRIWIGEEGSIRGLLDRIGRAERDAAREEDEANRQHNNKSQQGAGEGSEGGDDEPPVNRPTVQSSFEDVLFNEREGLVTKLRTTLQADAYTTLPKSEWQRAFGEIEPLYQLLKERSGF